MKDGSNGSNGYNQGPWTLDELFAGVDSPEVQAALEEMEEQVIAFEAARTQLEGGLDEETFTALLEDYEQLYRLASRLSGFASLTFAADTQNQQAQSFMARTQQVIAEMDNRTMFFKLWWKQLGEEEAARLLEAAGPYRYWLEQLRLQRPYTLSEAEERVINLKDVNGANALNTLYDSITNRYEFHLTVDGDERELTFGELTVYYRHPDPALRAAAYQELLRVFGRDEPILGQIYQALVRDWRSEHVALRGYEAPIAVRNRANHVPDEVVDTLLDVCRENADLFQSYFRLKARWLSVERLRRYDVYAPITATEKEYPFADAVALVLESYRQFEPKIARLARRVFDEGHLDSEVRKGKRNGAFCATITPDLTPWVLQSYQGRPGDVMTLAHELGHAVHSLLADHNPALTQHPSLPMAETASTFGEMLVVDRLLAEERDPAVRQTLLFRQMDDAYATIMRQAYFAIFERQAHAAIHEGAAVDDVSDLYLETLEDQFGDSLDLDDAYRHEWVAIPHIYKSPFYVYAYAFGQLLVLSLYQQFQQEGESFKPRYLEILAAGGSDAPICILERAGIDVHSADFWQGGFDVLWALLEELEEMTAPVA